MGFEPGRIVVVNFGRYGKDNKGNYKSSPPSLAQIPLIEYKFHSDKLKGFKYLKYYLAVPEKVYPREIEPNDLEYLNDVLKGYGIFDPDNITIKCEGRGWAGCNGKAEKLLIPFKKERNKEERISRGRPEIINQTYFKSSGFFCPNCAGVFSEIAGKNTYDMKIGFNAPDEIHEEIKRGEVNLSGKDFMEKMKSVLYRVLDQDPNDIIDTNRKLSKKHRFTRINAQKVVASLLGYNPDSVPENIEDYNIDNLSLSESKQGIQTSLF